MQITVLIVAITEPLQKQFTLNKRNRGERLNSPNKKGAIKMKLSKIVSELESRQCYLESKLEAAKMKMNCADSEKEMKVAKRLYDEMYKERDSISLMLNHLKLGR